MKKAVPYYRVSMERQGISGLGLEAQQKTVKDYAAKNGYELLQEFTEVESGRRTFTKKKGRLQLKAALELCKKEGATLLIAKLDRLSRNVTFVSSLMESGVEFIAIDYPQASKFIIHIMAAVAEHEADMISIRTKDALQAAKRRGVVLGRNGKDLSKENKIKADKFAQEMKPIIEKLRKSNVRSTRAIAAQLNLEGVKTFRGDDSKWHRTSVCNLLQRIRELDNLAA